MSRLNFLFLLSNRIWVIGAGFHKTLVRMANREDPDNIASSDVVSTEAV